MRRSASEVIRNLERRIARLENRSAKLTPYPQTKIHDPRIDMEVIEWSFGDIGKIRNEHPSTGELEALSAKSLERALKDTHMLIQELIGEGRLEKNLWDHAEGEIAEQYFDWGQGVSREVYEDLEWMFESFLMEYEDGFSTTPLRGKFARLERSTMKKASTDMPSEAESQLLDEIYDEMDLEFDASHIRVLDSKSVAGSRLTGGGSSIYLVRVGNAILPGIYAVVKCEMDEPNSFGCEVLDIVDNPRSATNIFRTAR